MSSGKHTSGRWSTNEVENSINYLELLGIFYALQAFYHDRRNTHIEVQSDNTTAVSYINEFDGMPSVKMDLLVKDIWSWCLNRGIIISAFHIPGSVNTADFHSRNFSDSTEWMLKTDIFERLCQHFFLPDVDLFASRLNKRLEKFVSWFPEPDALFVMHLILSGQTSDLMLFRHLVWLVKSSTRFCRTEYKNVS